MKVIFPSNYKAKYYYRHIYYIAHIFKYYGADIEFKPNLIIQPTVFKCYIDGKPFIFDLADYEDISYNIKDEIVLKRTLRNNINNVYPLGCFMGYYNNVSDYRIYANLILERDIIKNPEEEYLYCQRIFGNATHKREALNNFVGGQKPIKNPVQYWKYAKTFKYNIFLPGANDYVLDRAPSELMFLGCTIMHPKIDILFPEFKKLEAGKHYIEISNTGLDCLEKMKDSTGEAAKDFMQCMLPKNLVNWWTSL